MNLRRPRSKLERNCFVLKRAKNSGVLLLNTVGRRAMVFASSFHLGKLEFACGARVGRAKSDLSVNSHRRAKTSSSCSRTSAFPRRRALDWLYLPPTVLTMSHSAVLIEPWTFIEQADQPRNERAKKVLASPRISSDTTPPLGLAPLSKLEELEMLVQWLLWMVACMLPLASLAWLTMRPSMAAMAFALAVGLSTCWPNREWPVPPSSRLEMPLRNKKVAAAFMRYFPLRVIVEAPERLLGPEQEQGTRLFAGVPHGLFPIGFVLLGFCNFVMPWKRMRAAAASVTLRLPIWRQVALWNGGIDVNRGTLVKALRQGENVIVAMDGIAGMFASRRHQGKEVRESDVCIF